MCTLVKITFIQRTKNIQGGAVPSSTLRQQGGQNKQGEGAPIYGPLSKRGGGGKQNTGAYANTGIPKCAFCTDFKWHAGRADIEGEIGLAYIGVSRGFEASLVKFGHSSGAKFCSAYSVKQS